MTIDLTGISNVNEYYTNHYLNSVFEENASDTISKWRNEAKEREEIRTPWSLLRESAKQYYVMHEKRLRNRSSQMTPYIRDMADIYISALGYKKSEPFTVSVDEGVNSAYVYTEIKKQNGAPLLWILLSNQESDEDTALLYQYCFDVDTLENRQPLKSSLCNNEDLATKIFYSLAEAPRWLIIIGENTIALLDRNKWNEKRFLEFDLEEIFRRREESTLQAMSVLLHKDSICPTEGIPLLDTLDENSHKHASGVSQDLKYALRESIELLGNEILFDMANRQGVDLNENPVDAGELSIQCLRYMYRMLFLLFIEARPELGYAPMKSQVYLKGYSLETLRDIADNIREETSEVGEGYYLHDTLSKLYELIYNGYPKTEKELRELTSAESFHDIFIIDPLKAHIFDPEYTKLISHVKLRNCVMLKIIDLMSITRPTGRRNDKRGRISYAALGINQMGAVYEALLSYRGFIAQETLFEVKREQDEINELDVGYFVPENELSNYTEDERARYEDGKLRRYEKGTFIYRLAGREREKSASYYTPEVLTKCLVKYALQELLENKTADEILHLTICDPPYNTGNDFVYPDNFTDSIENYKEITGQIDSEGKNISSNSETNGRYHTDWLNMMYPRLRLARNLLTDDGVIFISIDDNESANLTKICDEIFGEVNFITKIIHKNNSMKNQSKYIGVSTEYIYIYTKNVDILKEIQTEWRTKKKGAADINALYKKLKEKRLSLEEIRENIMEMYSRPKYTHLSRWNKVDDIGVFKDQDLSRDNGPKDYTIINPITNKPCVIPNRGWGKSYDELLRLQKEDLIWYGDDNTPPGMKTYLDEESVSVPDNFYFADTSIDKKTIDEMFQCKVFEFPKSLDLMRYLQQLCTKNNDIIIDFFSGSSTTAHAVMQLNAEDGGNRKFIMVQLPETCDEKSEAYKAGYKNICEIGKERIRRAGEKIKEEKGIEALNLDIGFKVLKLDSSNIKKWQPDYEKLELSLTDYISNFIDGRTELDVVYEIMLKYGLDLTYQVDEHIINGKKVYSIGFGMLIICLDNEITTDVANEILNLVNELSPENTRVVFKDNGFKTDSNKTNIKEILKCGGIKEFITI